MGKVAVVGAGPAGIAAAIQLVRDGHDVQVFERGRVGGALWNARWVDNYPGFPGGVSGAELAGLMESQFHEYIGNVIADEVREIHRTDDGYSIMGFDFDGVVICVGTVPNRAGFRGEDELAHAGLLYYGIADASDWSGVSEVAVIGGGEASMDMALNIAMAGLKVTLLHRSGPSGVLALREAAMAEEGITWLQEEVKEGRVSDKAVLKTSTAEREFDRVIVAVGRQAVMPATDGFTVDKPPLGVLVAGDAARGSLGQVGMAVGDGVEAATVMSRYLEALD